MVRFVRAPRRLAAWLRTHRPTLRWPRPAKSASSAAAPLASPATQAAQARALRHLPPRVALAVRRAQRAHAAPQD